MAFPVVEIEAVSRQMRGGSQGWLVVGDDGQSYVAKFAGNPQGNRTLINEWMAYPFFRRLGISTPVLRILRLSERVRNEAGLSFLVGKGRIPVSPGLHLGSLCPVDPRTTAIFDLMPRTLLRHVINLEDFAQTWVLDKLFGQTDGRQCIFVREAQAKQGLSLRAYMIDHGQIFGGGQWRFQDSPLHGRFADLSVYRMIDLHAICGEALQVVRTIRQSELQETAVDIPRAWFGEGDDRDFAELLAALYNRIQRIGSILCWQFHCLSLDAFQATHPPTGSQLTSVQPNVCPVWS